MKKPKLITVTYRRFELTAFPQREGFKIGLRKDIPDTNCFVSCSLESFINWENPNYQLKFSSADDGFAKAREVIDSKPSEYFPEEN